MQNGQLNASSLKAGDLKGIFIMFYRFHMIIDYHFF